MSHGQRKNFKERKNTSLMIFDNLMNCFFSFKNPKTSLMKEQQKKLMMRSMCIVMDGHIGTLKGRYL